MKKKVNLNRFDDFVATAESLNKALKYKRFWPIRAKEGKILIFGMYDYETKRHIISKPFMDVNEVFNEIENMLKKASKS